MEIGIVIDSFDIINYYPPKQIYNNVTNEEFLFFSKTEEFFEIRKGGYYPVGFKIEKAGEYNIDVKLLEGDFDTFLTGKPKYLFKYINEDSGLVYES